MTRRRLAFLLAAALVTVAARPVPADFAWQPHPGASVPLDGRFTDSTGRPVSLRDLAGRPIVVALGYFRCPSLCGPVRNDVLAALKESGLRGGQDYRLAVLSVDARETVQDAADAKRADLAQDGGSGVGWSYLVGDAAPVAEAVGFPFRWDPDLQQFAHPAGIVVLTPTGRVGAYLQGAGYTGADLRRAVGTAAAEQIAAAPSPILLLCFHYDAATGRYTLAIYKVLRLMGVMTLLGIAGLLVLLQRRRQRVT